MRQLQANERRAVKALEEDLQAAEAARRENKSGPFSRATLPSDAAAVLRISSKDLSGHEKLAEWLRRLAVLLVDENSQTHGFLDELAPLLSLDPDFDSLSSGADLVGDPELVEALLRVLETPEVAAALADPSSGATGQEGPIGLVGRLSSDGSLESVLTLLVWVMDTFDGLGLFHGE